MDFRLHVRKNSNNKISSNKCLEPISDMRTSSIDSSRTRKRNHLNRTPKREHHTRPVNGSPTIKINNYWLHSPARKQQRVRNDGQMRIDVVWDGEDARQQQQQRCAVRLSNAQQKFCVAANNRNNQTKNNSSLDARTSLQRPNKSIVGHSNPIAASTSFANKNNNSAVVTTTTKPKSTVSSVQSPIVEQPRFKFDDMLHQFRDKLNFCKQNQSCTFESLESMFLNEEDDDFDEDDWLCDLPSNNGAVQVEPNGIIIHSSIPNHSTSSSGESSSSSKTVSHSFAKPNTAPTTTANRNFVPPPVDHIFQVPITPIKNLRPFNFNKSATAPARNLQSQAFTAYRSPSKYCSTPMSKTTGIPSPARSIAPRTPTKFGSLDQSGDTFDESLDILFSQLDDRAIVGLSTPKKDASSTSFQFDDDDDIDFFKLDEALDVKRSVKSIEDNNLLQTNAIVKSNDQSRLLHNSLDSVSWDDDLDQVISQI